MVCKEEDADGPRFDYITEVWSGDVETLTGFAWFAMSEDGKVIFEARATLMDASRTVAGPVGNNHFLNSSPIGDRCLAILRGLKLPAGSIDTIDNDVSVLELETTCLGGRIRVEDEPEVQQGHPEVRSKTRAS